MQIDAIQSTYTIRMIRNYYLLLNLFYLDPQNEIASGCQDILIQPNRIVR